MAVEQREARAQLNLGLMYSRGDGVTKDYDDASKLFRKATEQGDGDPEEDSISLRIRSS
jgi:TPR repeat protein